MKKLLFSLSLFSIIALSCTKVTPNQWMVVTSDCWQTSKVVKAGEVPPRLLTYCDQKIVLPAYLMDGQVKVQCRFKGDVKGTLNLDYQYEIIDPQAFIQAAKFITSAATDDNGLVDLNTLEKAENLAIDKIVKDVTREYIPTVNPIDIEESKIESDILEQVNKTLSERGVKMIAPSCQIDFQSQTEVALDAVSAYNLYKNAGLERLGEGIITNQALKPEINIQMQTTPVPQE